MNRDPRGTLASEMVEHTVQDYTSYRLRKGVPRLLSCGRGRFARPPILKRDTIPSMATEHILALLVAERDKLNAAIEALSGPTKRREDDAQRKAAGERMRQIWAAKKKAAAKVKKAG